MQPIFTKRSGHADQPWWKVAVDATMIRFRLLETAYQTPSNTITTHVNLLVIPCLQLQALATVATTSVSESNPTNKMQLQVTKVVRCCRWESPLARQYVVPPRKSHTSKVTITNWHSYANRFQYTVIDYRRMLHPIFIKIHVVAWC